MKTRHTELFVLFEVFVGFTLNPLYTEIPVRWDVDNISPSYRGTFFIPSFFFVSTKAIELNKSLTARLEGCKIGKKKGEEKFSIKVLMYN